MNRACATTFKSLGFPLKNTRWSWGAVNEENQSVLFRFWAHQMPKVGTLNFKTPNTLKDDAFCALLYNHSQHVETDTLNDPGTKERRAQLELVNQGYKAFGICVHSKRDEAGRFTYEMETHISKRVWVFGERLEVETEYVDNPDIYFAISNVIPVKELSSLL